MEYQTYDELIALVAEFRSKHRNLTEDEQDKLIKKTFRIDQGTLRELDGVSDLIQYIEDGKGTTLI
jgi:vacuolar-type H+-ATPase subunit C/Vma6